MIERVNSRAPCGEREVLSDARRALRVSRRRLEVETTAMTNFNVIKVWD